MSVEFTFGLVALFVVLFLLATKWSHTYWIRKGTPQIKPNLFFGNILHTVTGEKSLYDLYTDLYFYGKKAGHKFFGMYSFWSPEIVIVDRQLIKQILTKDFPYVSSHGQFHHKSNPLLMHTFNMYGQPWKDRRMKMSALFTSGKLKTVFETLIKKSDNLIQYLSKQVDEKKPVNAKEAMARFTTDSITNVVFGINTDSFNESDLLFRKIGIEFSKPRNINVLLEKLFPHHILGNLGYKTFSASSSNAFSKLIREIIKYREKTGFRRNDFMDLMLQLKKYGSLIQDNGELQKERLYLNDEEILAESFLFFVAGYETSSTTAAFALFELSRHPEYQDKLREEILVVLQKYNGKLTYEGLSEMTYLDQVIKDTLRLYPIVLFLPRECTQRYTIPESNVVIEKGTKVHIPISGLQKDPEFYENPEEFNPDNFSQEKIDQRPEGTWLPFGFGPRQCIGMRLGLMQSKLGVIAALRNFKLTLHESMKPPYKTSPGTIVLSFKNDPIINFTRL